MLTWVPREDGDTRLIYVKGSAVYFILDQDPVKSLQSPIKPGEEARELTPLSEWLVEFAQSWGRYMDTLESAKDIETFKTDPLFNWNEYYPPPSGYLTFNQFFARHVRPGMRPVAGPCDDRVLVAPVDSTFVGWWQISESSQITVENQTDAEAGLNIKGLRWSIHQLLEGSAYADRFKGGIFTHSYLNTFDYHRIHTPVQGRVLETNVIPGQAYLDVKVASAVVDGKTINVLDATDGTGYQFVQIRGVALIDSPIGLVAVIPIGMSAIASVVFTAEKGVTLQKGEELGYFQFGGSDVVMVFERASNVQLITRPNVHYNQGTWIGSAFPYSLK